MSRPKLYPAQCPTERNAAGLRMCSYVLCRHNLVADRVDIDRLVRRVGDMPLMASAAEDDAAELIARECERPLFSCSLDFADVEWQRLQDDDESEFDGTIEWGGRPQRGTAYAVPTETIGQQLGFTGERMRQIGKEAEVKMGLGLELFVREPVAALQCIGEEPYQFAQCGDEKLLLVTGELGRTEAFRTGGASELAAYIEDGQVVWEEPFGLEEPTDVWAADFAKMAGKGKSK